MTNPPRTRFVVIAGGGTAGHVHPGLAVARALIARGLPADRILYVGSERGIEQQLVPAAGIELVTVPGKGIPRKVGVEAVRALVSLVHGIWVAFRLLGTEKPDVVLSLGGFAAIPCAVAARIRRIPVVIHEQNAVPGAANRLIGRWARASALSFADTALPNATVTGNPVRPEMLAVDRASQRAEARARLGVAPEQKMVVVTGGSLGALRLNRAALDAARHWSSHGEITLHHVIGARDWDELEADRSSIAGAIDYRPVRFEDDMPAVFAAADVVVSRAGASIIAELAAVGMPAVLVPLPGAPGDHQTLNASALVNAGGAVMVSDAQLDGSAMVGLVEDLFAEPDALRRMSAAARTIGRPDAASLVADLLEEHAR